MYIMKLVLNYVCLICFLTISCSAEKITILTRQVTHENIGFWFHPTVTNSLLRGLQNLQVDFNYNPSNLNEVASTVVVLSDLNALSQAIDWKKTGRIKKLLAGPNLVISPLDQKEIITSPYIDRYLVNSEWVKKAYIEDAPDMMRNIAIWPSGVDSNYWNRSKKAKKHNRDVLVYWKTESEQFCIDVENILKKYSWRPVRIRYGQYNFGMFKQMLENSVFSVFISKSESQGIALLEAWSMDIPTFVWNSKEPLIINNRLYSEYSACPYLTPDTGLKWRNLEEFEILLHQMPQKLASFHPREWVLKNMSDTVSVKILLSIIDSI